MATESEDLGASTEPPSFLDALNRIPHFIDNNNVLSMIDTQVATLDRLECTNKSLSNCSNMAQSKLVTTTKLYKKTAKQLAEAKKDLDVCYKKILDLKMKMKAEQPDLFVNDSAADDLEE